MTEIKPGDTVRMTEEAYRGLQRTGFRNGQVMEVSEGRAVVEWVDEELPREVGVGSLEKVERKKSEGHLSKLGGFEVGDRVRHSDGFLKRSGADRDISDMRGEIVELKEGPARAKVMWEGEEEARGSLLSNLARVKERGR